MRTIKRLQWRSRAGDGDVGCLVMLGLVCAAFVAIFIAGSRADARRAEEEAAELARRLEVNTAEAEKWEGGALVLEVRQAMHEHSYKGHISRSWTTVAIVQNAADPGKRLDIAIPSVHTATRGDRWSLSLDESANFALDKLLEPVAASMLLEKQ